MIVCARRNGQGIGFFFCCGWLHEVMYLFCLCFSSLTSSTIAIVRQAAPQIDLCPEGICTSSESHFYNLVCKIVCLASLCTLCQYVWHHCVHYVNMFGIIVYIMSICLASLCTLCQYVWHHCVHYVNMFGIIVYIMSICLASLCTLCQYVWHHCVHYVNPLK